MAYDRIIRAELYQSERWVSLSTDTHRLVFNALIHVADDFGNLEGGSMRLWRWMHTFSQVKTEQDAIKIMSDMADADLVRRYEVDDKGYWHIPRFKNTRRYTSRKCPRSPWCDSAILSTVEKERNGNREETPKPAADLPQTSGRPAAYLLRGVGVGVGEKMPIPPNGGTIPSDQKPGQQGQREISNAWDLGVALLGEQGLKEKSARAFVGSLLKDWDEAAVEDAFRASAGKADVKAYVRSVLRTKPKKEESTKQRLVL